MKLSVVLQILVKKMYSGKVLPSFYVHPPLISKASTFAYLTGPIPIETLEKQHLTLIFS